MSWSVRSAVREDPAPFSFGPASTLTERPDATRAGDLGGASTSAVGGWIYFEWSEHNRKGSMATRRVEPDSDVKAIQPGALFRRPSPERAVGRTQQHKRRLSTRRNDAGRARSSLERVHFPGSSSGTVAIRPADGGPLPLYNHAGTTTFGYPPNGATSGGSKSWNGGNVPAIRPPGRVSSPGAMHASARRRDAAYTWKWLPITHAGLVPDALPDRGRIIGGKQPAEKELQPDEAERLRAKNGRKSPCAA